VFDRVVTSDHLVQSIYLSIIFISSRLQLHHDSVLRSEFLSTIPRVESRHRHFRLCSFITHILTFSLTICRIPSIVGSLHMLLSPLKRFCCCSLGLWTVQIVTCALNYSFNKNKFPWNKQVYRMTVPSLFILMYSREENIMRQFLSDCNLPVAEMSQPLRRPRGQPLTKKMTGLKFDLTADCKSTWVTYMTDGDDLRV
jgi:hypothetical protein